MNPDYRVSYGICQVHGSDERVVGLGFAVDRNHVLTCAHVINASIGRELRAASWPELPSGVTLDFPIGATGSGTRRVGHLTRWLPADGPFDAKDMALLRVSGELPAHVGSPRFAKPLPTTAVQMWGRPLDRPDGVYVLGKLLGEVIGGRLQIETEGRRFRAQPGFSGGPVWSSQTGQIVGILTACGSEPDAVDAYVLDVHEVLPRRPFPEYGVDWANFRDLLTRIEEAARHHPYLRDATIRLVEAERSHEMTHLRATQQRIGISGQVLGSSEIPIGAHVGDLTAESIDQFVDIVASPYRIGGSVGEAIVVYTGVPPDPDLASYANMRGINLLSFVEFQGGYDLRPFSERQSHQLENDPVYRPKSYIPQHYYEPPERRSRPDPLHEKIINWLAEPDGHLIIVLAPFGHGKTFLLHEVARRMHAQDHPAIPVLVRLRDLEKAHGIDELLVTQLTKGGERRIDLDRLRYLRQEGRIALLFDGFDELAVRSTYDSVTAHLTTIVGAAEGRAKVVVTSRREYFLSDREVEQAMGERLSTIAGRRIVAIEGFDSDQIQRFLMNRFGAAQTTRWLALLQDLDLMELAATPRMLEFITAIPEETLYAVTVREGTITRAVVFSQILEFWLDFEEQRLSVGRTIAGPTKSNLLTAISGLAVRLWMSPQEDLGLQELGVGGEVLIKLAQSGSQAAAMEPGEAAQMLGSATLLVRTGEGRFGFVHRSVMEYLVAVDAAHRLKSGEKLPEILRLPLSPLIIEFLDGLAGRQAITAWIVEALSDLSEGSRSNALEVANQLGITTTQRLRMANQDLRGRNLEGHANFAQADFRNTNLTEARLTRLNFSGADLSGAVLVRARLDHANLSQTILAGTDLTGARLLGADLTQVAWEGVKSLSRATVLGAKLDDSARAVLSAHGVLEESIPVTVETQQAEAAVEAVCYDLTGALIAAACDDGTVRVWDETMGHLVRTLSGHTGPVHAIGWSRDGQHLVSGAADGQIRIWDAKSGSLARTISGHAGSVLSIDWSSDGRYLVTGGADGVVCGWNAATGERCWTVSGLYGSVFAVACSPTEAILAVAGDNHNVSVLNAADGSLVGEIVGHRSWVRALAWSPDGKCIAAGGEDRAVRIWDSASRNELKTLSGHSGAVHGISWSLTGSHLASCGGDGIWIWSMPSGQRDHLLYGHSGRATSVTWSPDGDRVVCGDDRSVRIWAASSGEMIRALIGSRVAQTAVAWSPDGQLLAAGGDDSIVRIWRSWSGSLRHSLFGHRGSVIAISWSGDSQTVATSGSDGLVRFWGAESGDLRYVVSGFGKVSWAPDDERFAVGFNHLVKVSSLQQPRNERSLVEHRSTVVAVAWAPDGDRLASASADGNVVIWDCGTWMPRFTFAAHSSAVTGLFWSGDGTELITAGTDRAVRFWCVAQDVRIDRTIGVFDHGVASLKSSSDGETLLVVGDDRTVMFFDVRTGAPLTSPTVSACATCAADWSPDGKLLALGLGSGILRLARWPNLERVVELLPLADNGWIAFLEGLRYKYSGIARREFWYAMGFARFEVGVLDPYVDGLERVATYDELLPHADPFDWPPIS